MSINVELRRSDGVDFDEVVYVATDITIVNGLLDGNNKINLSLLPAGVIGGMSLKGTINASTQNLDTIAALLDGLSSDAGKYFVVTTAGYIDDTGTTAKWHANALDDEIDAPPIIDLEVGDWIICTGYETDHNVFAVINNTYPDATTSVKGIVMLENSVILNDSTKAATAAAVKLAYDTGNHAHNYYVHPTQSVINYSNSGIVIPSEITVNDLGHVTNISSRSLPSAAEGVEGIVELASLIHAKNGTENSNAMTALRVKEAIDFHHGIPIDTATQLNADIAKYKSGKLAFAIV